MVLSQNLDDKKLKMLMIKFKLIQEISLLYFLIILRCKKKTISDVIYLKVLKCKGFMLPLKCFI